MISVFTPMSESGRRYIEDTWNSLLTQTHDDWEWVIVENHGGRAPDKVRQHPRVRIYSSNAEGIGALKREACGYCYGDVLLELDHDDLLDPEALARVAEAMAAGADFCYSDFAEFCDGTWEPNPYSETYGWQGYDVAAPSLTATNLLAMRAPANPLDWRKIEWSPNHLRAWRRSFYERIGGHDASLAVCDDHDLVLRTYLADARIAYIPHCLYFYRVHAAQTVKLQNAGIQSGDWTVYDRYAYRLYEHIARKRGLQLIDLCGAHAKPEAYRSLDIDERADIVADLDWTWPLEESTVGVLRAFDAIEHLRNPVHTMNEAWRVLAPGGVLLIRVPSTDGKGAFCDPTHVSFWNSLSFRYYTNSAFSRYVPKFQGRFQVARLYDDTSGVVPYVVCELIALKGDWRPMGEILI